MAEAPNDSLPRLDDIKHGLLSVPLPEHLITDPGVTIRICKWEDEGHANWSVVRAPGEEELVFVALCPNCHGDVYVADARGEYCHWCGHQIGSQQFKVAGE